MKSLLPLTSSDSNTPYLDIKIRNTIIGSIVAGVITLFFSIFYFTTGLYFLALINFGMVFIVIACGLIVRFLPGKVLLAANLIILAIWLNVIVSCFVSGGLISSSTPWLAIVPFFALFTANILSGTIWTGISILSLICLHVLHVLEVPRPLDLPSTAIDRLIDTLMMTIVIVFASIVSEVSIRRVLQNMKKSQQEAEETAIKMTEISKQLEKDIAKRKKVEKKLQVLATTDPLTGLFNRRHFRELTIIELSRAKRYKKDISLLMIDIDHFKRINDNYGHTTGDKGLIALSNLFADTLRDIDIMARYGGEEFVILLPETSKSAALTVAERLRRDVEQMIIETDPAAFSFTISIGISSFIPVDAASIDTLLDEADKALYASKQMGRNRVTVWEAII